MRRRDVQYQGIVFDFNGVLLWDADFHVDSWQGVARDLRGHSMTEDELATHMHGRPNAYVLMYLAGRVVEGKELLDLIQVKESFYRKLCLMNPRRFVLSPGAEELLETLTKHNIPRTIATSSEITNLEFFIQHLRLDRWFDVQKIVYDDGVRPGKPAPDIYLTAAQNIGVSPSHCVVIEDASSGIRSARAAGMGYVVGLGPRATHATLLAQEGVADVIETLAHFPREALMEHR